MIRALVVDDSATFRLLLHRLLEEDPELVVIAEARSGAEALRLCREHSPDLVLMDFMMPGMNGPMATAQLMQLCPCPVVIWSSLMDSHGQQILFEGLRAGAVDVLAKPRETDGARARDRLRATLRAMAQVKVIRRRLTATPVPAGGAVRRADLVLVGASTGGPAAICQLFGALPEDFPLPILVAQHLGAGFGEGFCRWLAGCLPIPVRQVQGSVELDRGLYLAPDRCHLEVLSPFRARSVPAAPDDLAPSVDRLFSSAVPAAASVVALLLTGMGDDGAAGLQCLREAGAHTVIQDEASALVYGMPRAAKQRGAACEELSLSSMQARLLEFAGHG